MLEKYKGKKILIAGFETEGKATFDFLRQNGIRADIADLLTPVIPAPDRVEGKAPAGIQPSPTQVFTGKDYLNSASDYDVIFRTPGLSPLNPLLLGAQKNGTEVTSQIKLFMELCSAKTIGVTGTKGKGTTATLIYEILQASGKDVYLGGNIGVPAISLIDELNKDSIVVLELSSFQLMDLDRSPNIAVVLGITSEHLDYHKNRDEYVDAKKSIVKFQRSEDFAVINTDYETSSSFAGLTQADIFEVSTLSPVIPSEALAKSRDLLNYDERKGFLRSSLQEVGRNDRICGGCYVDENDEIILIGKNEEEKIASFSELQLRGRHNLENVCAAVMGSSLAGADFELIRKTVRSFKGLEHRLEFVAEKGGVKYYNDSFSTTPESTIAAVKAFEEPVLLIAGGSEKGSDYSEMSEVIAKKAKTIFLIGQTANKIKRQILKINPKADVREGYENMEDLVKRVDNASKPGDVVVLSPGCASFDIFQNYKERGDLFKEAVAKLIRD